MPTGDEVTAKPSRRREWVGLVVMIVLVGHRCYQELYGGRAGISVQCVSDGPGYRCTASHVSGGAAVSACWWVALTCRNGNEATARTCAALVPNEEETVSLPENVFLGRGQCDEVVAFEVRDKTVSAL
jgi:hypothetical protein